MKLVEADLKGRLINYQKNPIDNGVWVMLLWKSTTLVT